MARTKPLLTLSFKFDMSHEFVILQRLDIKDWIVVDAFTISSNGTKLIDSLDSSMYIMPLVSKPGVSVYMVAGMRVIAPSL